MESSSLSARALSARRPRPFSRGRRKPSGELNLPNEPILDRYFSVNAQSQFIQTYKQILHHADIIHGGRKELKSFVKNGQGSSIFKETREKLKSLGAITPRQQKGNHTNRQQNKKFPNLPPLQIENSAVSPKASRTSNLDIDNSDDSDCEEDIYNPESPRAIFLAGCVRQRIPPRSVAMLRKRISPKLNLAHMSIGNEIAILLSEALEKMPYLQILNISDNNLNDIGLSAIIHSAARHGTLEELDISLNVIDDKAADALATYIGNENCPLKCLRMSGAGIDDKECARFVEVLMQNRCLRELDMSKNLLGKDENLNVVKPDFVTGGEILADLLRDSTCPLQTLNLHWNMIRLEGAEVLCDALRSNTYLTNLDLSFNALGTHAACILGSALLENDTLKILNLANNAIDCIGALTLSVGMRENVSLRSVILDGNPIGEQGARGLMKAVAQEGHRLTISTLNCDIVTKSSNVKMKLDTPVGDYLLCMNHPYDRAIAYEALDIVANDANYEIGGCDIYLAGNESNVRSTNSGVVVGKEGGLVENLRFGTEHLGPLVSSFIVNRFNEVKPKERVFVEEVAEKGFLDVLAALTDVDQRNVELVASRYDFSRTHVIEVDNLSALLHDLLMHDHVDEDLSVYKKIRRSFSQEALAKESNVEIITLEAPTNDDDNNNSNVFVSQTISDDAERQELNELGIFIETVKSTSGAVTPALAHARSSNGNINVAPEILQSSPVEDHPDIVAMNKLLQNLVDDCLRILDSRSTGVIDLNLFVEYILQRSKIAKLRAFEVQHLSRCCVRLKNGSPVPVSANSNNEKTLATTSSRPQTGSAGNSSVSRGGPIRYHPPAHGWMRIRLIESFYFGVSKTSTSNISTDPNQVSTPSAPRSAPQSASGSTPKVNTNKFNMKDNDFYRDRSGGYTMSRARCLRLIEDMKQATKAQPLTLLQYALENVWLRLEEAQLIYSFARNRADDPIAILTSILLRMINTFEAKRMVQFATADDVMKLRRVKQRLGSAYFPLVGIYTGYYYLDLSNSVDRKCLKSLIEKSSSDMEYRRIQGLNDTSQHGHWSCFRNEHYRPGVPTSSTKKPGTATGTSGGQTAGDSMINSEFATFLSRHDGSAPAMIVIPKFFCPIPSSGYLEFDFVNVHRPTILKCRPAQDSILTDCLLLSRLLENDDIDWALDRLRQFRRLNRVTMFPAGTPAYRIGVGRAERVAEQLNGLYSSLAQRQLSRKATQIKEGLSNVQNRKKDKNDGTNTSADKKRPTEYTAATNKPATTGSGTMRKMFAIARAAAAEAEAEASELAAEEERVEAAKASSNKLRFRSFARQGNRVKNKLNMWEMRMIEVVYGSKGTDEYKASVLLEFFEVELAIYWLECRHVALLLEMYTPIGMINRSSFGTYRVDLLISVFDRIVDLHNFEIIWSLLNAEEHAAVYARIGCLNLFNPCKCEGGWSLSLGRWEEVQLVKMMVHLSIVEPGQNWLNQVFALYRGSAPVPSWELNRAWFSEDGLPRNGQISFEMYAGDGLRLANCTVNPVLRQMLTSLTLVAQRNYVAEADFMSCDPALSALASYQSSPQPKSRYGGMIVSDMDGIAAGEEGASHLHGISEFGDVIGPPPTNMQSAAVEGGITTAMHDMFTGDMSLIEGVGVTEDEVFTYEQLARIKESRMMLGLAQHQRIILYALSHGTGTIDEVKEHQEHVAKYKDLLEQEHYQNPLLHAVHFERDVLDDHYHDVAHYTIQDVHEQLAKSTDIQWTYSTSRKPEIWI